MRRGPLPPSPELRNLLVDIHWSYWQTIDTVSAYQLIEAGFSDDQAGRVVQSFRAFVE